MDATTPADIPLRSPRRRRMRRLRLLTRVRAMWRLLVQRASSSLTRRIVVLNLAGLVALLVGFLYLNQFRQGLIEARVQSLLTQSEIIAGAIAASATVDSDTINIDPDRLLQMQAGESSRSARRRCRRSSSRSTRSASRRCCAASSARPARGR